VSGVKGIIGVSLYANNALDEKAPVIRAPFGLFTGPQWDTAAIWRGAAVQVPNFSREAGA
jgi:hypothetical protein